MPSRWDRLHQTSKYIIRTVSPQKYTLRTLSCGATHKTDEVDVCSLKLIEHHRALSVCRHDEQKEGKKFNLIYIALGECNNFLFVAVNKWISLCFSCRRRQAINPGPIIVFFFALSKLERIFLLKS